MSAAERPDEGCNQPAVARINRAWTREQKAALEALFGAHKELRLHGGAEGAFAKLQHSHPQLFLHETAQRVGQWFKTRRKAHNKQLRIEADAAEGRMYRQAEQIQENIAEQDQQTDQSEGIRHPPEPIQAEQLAPEDIFGRSTGRHRKSAAEYKLRQSLCQTVDKYHSKARGRTEILLCISSSSQKETFWVHGRGLAMNSSARRSIVGKAFKEVISKKREEVDDGILSDGEEEGGGGVRQGNYSHQPSAYFNFFSTSEHFLRQELRDRQLTASQHFVAKLCAKLWQILTPEEREMVDNEARLRALMAQQPSLWTEGTVLALRSPRMHIKMSVTML